MWVEQDIEPSLPQRAPGMLRRILRQTHRKELRMLAEARAKYWHARLRCTLCSILHTSFAHSGAEACCCVGCWRTLLLQQGDCVLCMRADCTLFSSVACLKTCKCREANDCLDPPSKMQMPCAASCATHVQDLRSLERLRAHDVPLQKVLAGPVHGRHGLLQQLHAKVKKSDSASDKAQQQTEARGRRRRRRSASRDDSAYEADVSDSAESADGGAAATASEAGSCSRMQQVSGAPAGQQSPATRADSHRPPFGSLASFPILSPIASSESEG